jgi:hypothetical protein
MYRAGAFWFESEGWVIDFFVQPRELFPEHGQPIVDWCAERGVTMADDGIPWSSRIEMFACVPEDIAMEYKLRWGNIVR